MSSADDPEVQKNGFRELMREIGVDPRAIEDFFEQSFDPNASFLQNVEHFREHMEQVRSFLQGDRGKVQEALEDL